MSATIPDSNFKFCSTALPNQRRIQLESAWHAVKRGETTVHRAAKQFSIPKSTLWPWCQKNSLSEIYKAGQPVCYAKNNYDQALDAIINRKMAPFEAASRFDVSITELNQRLRSKRKVTSGADGTTIVNNSPGEHILSDGYVFGAKRSIETHYVQAPLDEDKDEPFDENKPQYKTPSLQAFTHRQTYHFMNRAEHERIEYWFNRIKVCVKLCEFGIHEDIMIIDKFLAGLDGSTLYRYIQQPYLTLADCLGLLLFDNSFDGDQLFDIAKVEPFDETTVQSQDVVGHGEGALDMLELAASDMSDIFDEEPMPEDMDVVGHGEGALDMIEIAASDMSDIFDEDSITHPPPSPSLKMKIILPKLAQKSAKKSTIQKPRQIQKSKLNYKSCPVCDKRATPENIQRHIYKRHFPHKSAFTCYLCKKWFNVFTRLKSHMRQTHCSWNKRTIIGYTMDRRKYVCIKCGERYASKASFGVHYRRHDESRIHSCELCNKKFLQIKHLRRHALQHKRDQRCLECHLCGQQFQRFASLRTHFTIRHCVRRDKRLQCDVCQTYFYSQKSLDKHMKVHEGPTIKFKCSHCDKEFKHRRNLTTHLKSVQRPENFICELCSKGYKTNAQLTEHRAVHFDDRNFPCISCGLRFKTSAQLRKHSSVHLQATPFSCELCGKTFRTNFLLSLHTKRTHIKSGEFECGVCQKWFRDKYSLDDHLAVHSGEKRYNCDYCDQEFIQRASVREHARRVHGRDLAPRAYRYGYVAPDHNDRPLGPM